MEEAGDLVPEKIKELFSAIAPRYDLLNRVLSFGIDRRWRERGVRYLLGYRRVLDLCAGTLALSRALLEADPIAEVTAVDFAEPMLSLGLTQLPAALRPRITTHCADFYQWNPTGGGYGGVISPRYDAAMCAYGMRNLENNLTALEKIHRLLRPGGRLVVLEFFRPDRWISRLFSRTYAEFLIPSIGRLISQHENAYRHLRDSVRGFYSQDEYISLLKEIGFEIVTAERMTGGISGLIVADKGAPAS